MMKTFLAGLYLAFAVSIISCHSHAIPTGSTPPSPAISPTPLPTPSSLPSPTPVPTPDSCPAVTRLGVNVQNTMNWAFQSVPKAEEGGYVVWDTTPKFGPAEAPCNDEHNVVCGGRKCEDPRGQTWEILEGPSYEASAVKIQEPGTDGKGFQLRLGPLKKGRHRVRACTPENLVDGEGYPVNGGACRASEEITVE